jgi:hypothetical protein
MLYVAIARAFDSKGKQIGEYRADFASHEALVTGLASLTDTGEHPRCPVVRVTVDIAISRLPVTASNN